MPDCEDRDLSDELFDRVLTLVYSGIEPPIGFRRFVDECSRAAPRPVWASIRRLDIPADLSRHTRWLKSVFKAEPPPSKVNGLWFGISDPQVDEEYRPIGYELYLVGSKSYDSQDLNFGWAGSQDWDPANRWSGSEVFHALGRIALEREGPDQPEEDWVYRLFDTHVPLLYAGLLVPWLAKRLPGLLLGRARSRAIGLGHDDGDPFLMGAVDARGFHPTSLETALDMGRRQAQETKRYVEGLERRLRKKTKP